MLHCDFSIYTLRHNDCVEKIEHGFFPSFLRWGKMGNILTMAKCKKTSKRRSHWKFVGSEKEMLYERWYHICLITLWDQLVNMNVGVPISFLILFALRGDLATAPCLSQTTGDHFPFGFKAFFLEFWDCKQWRFSHFRELVLESQMLGQPIIPFGKSSFLFGMNAWTDY